MLIFIATGHSGVDGHGPLPELSHETYVRRDTQLELHKTHKHNCMHNCEQNTLQH